MPELGEPLSDRELDVLQCLAEGASNREIARALSISPNTVKVHLRNIYTKLDVGSRTEATTVALQKGLLSIPGIEVQEEQAVEETDRPTASGDGMEAVEDSVAIILPPLSGETSLQKQELAVDGVLPPRRGDNRRLRWLLVLVGAATLVLGALIVTRPFAAEPTAAPTPSPEPFAETRLSEHWSESRSMDTARAGMAVAPVGLDVYHIGGETESGVDNAVYVFNTHERRWREAAPKLTAVSDAAAGVLAGEIYVAGGRQGNGQYTTAVEAYSPLNDAWRPVPSLPRPLAGAVALANGGLLYLFGGEDSEGTLADSYVYDPAIQRWQPLPPLPAPRSLASGGVLNGKLYVVAGSDGQQAQTSCSYFDPATATWESCPPLQQARAGAGAGTLLNKLYLFGGRGEGALTFSEAFNATEGQWDEIETPILETAPAWERPGVAVVETRLYILGGRKGETLSDDVYVYTPVVYQFFIPAASSPGG